MYHDKQAVQEFSERRPSTAPCSPSGDAVFITKDDLEGYHGTSDDAGKQLAVVPKVLKASPMIARLSCLFASLKVSGGCVPVVRRLPVPEPRACWAIPCLQELHELVACTEKHYGNK